MSGINSAMLAGVTGLSANSAALASISDDIANVNTVGYKANDTQFSDLVTETAGSGYAAGGVQALSTQNVSVQGVLQSASSPTDLAISGQGFFVTSQNASSPATAGNTPLFTRAGAFTENSQGYLVNAAGLYLQGWTANASGSVTTDPSNLALLQPINLAQISSTPEPTTQATVDANLESSTAVSQAATDASNSAANAATITAYASISSPTAAQTTAYNTAVAQTAAAYSATSATTSMAAYTNSGGTTGTQPDFTMQIPVSNTEGGTQTVQVDFLKSSTANQWYAEVVAVPASSVTVGSGLQAGQIATGVVAFNDSGQLDTTNTTLPSSLTFGASGSSAPSSTGVNWASSLGIGAQTVGLNLSALSQDNATSAVTSIAANGTPTGSLSSVDVSSTGTVTAVFSNGVTRTIAQVAVGTFANPDGLTSVSGDAYQSSTASGAFTLNTAGTGGAGTISPSNLESSTVDLSAEFTNMITVQRAYSASSKIITTADSMLQDLIAIIR
jgi:flagellar hook protein FlgE